MPPWRHEPFTEDLAHEAFFVPSTQKQCQGLAAAKSVTLDPFAGLEIPGNDIRLSLVLCEPKRI
jgi:hypothetical protein